MGKRIKKVIASLLVLSMGCISAEGFSVKAFAASTATVNVSAKDQRISGFGASSAWCGALSDSVMDYLYKDIGLSILRVRMEPNEGWSSGNYSKWNDELSNAKKAKARGAIVFATPWSAPPSMKSNNSVAGSNGATLKTSAIGDYAKYLKSYANYFANNGASLYAISLQNEPDWPADYDGCKWTADQFKSFLTTYGADLAKTTKIMMPESLGFNQALSNPTLNDATASSYVSIIGGHLYGAKIQDYPLARSKGKEIWMTEHYTKDLTIGGSMDFAKEVHDCMTVGNMSAYVYWWINNPENGLLNSSKQPLKRAYVLGQYAKFVRNGYYRVDATSNPQTNVYVSSYTGDNKVVIVAINKGTSAVTQSFNVKNGSVSKVSQWVTSNSANMAKGSDVTVSNGNFTASLPAQSVTTFVGSLDGSTVVVPDEPTTPSVTVPGNTVKLQDGWYYIKNVNAQKYLQVKDNTGKAVQNVELGTGTGAAGQKWYLKNVADGYVTLQSALGDFMIDIASAKNEDGANAQIYNAYSGNAQQFMLKSTGANGAYIIATKCSNLTKVLDDYNLGTADGTNVCQWTYGGKANQQWVFESTTNSSTGSNTGSGSTTVPSQPSASGKLDLTYTTDNWGSQYQVNFKITNNSDDAVSTWTLKLKKSEINIASSWSVNVKEDGDYYVITPMDYNANLAKGASTEFGIQGNGSVGSTISYTLN